MTEFRKENVVMAQMRKRKGKFQFIVNKTGYPTIYKTFINKSTGSQWAREVELQMEKKTFEDFNPASTTTVKDILIKYRDEITINKKGYREETCKINKLIRHKIGLNSLMTFKSHHVYSLIRELEKTMKKNTVVKYVALLRNAWNVAKRQWGITLPGTSPFDLVSIKKEDDTRDRILTSFEYKRLLTACAKSTLPGLSDIVEFAYLTGARQGEILRLNKKNIDWSKNICTFLDTKNSDDRRIPMSKQVQRIIKKYPFGFSVVPRRLRKHFHIACAKANIEDLRFHDLRASFCTNALLSGMSIAEVATLSGHRDWSMLKKYTRIKPEDLEDKVNKINVVTLKKKSLP
jgi:integrase